MNDQLEPRRRRRRDRSASRERIVIENNDENDENVENNDIDNNDENANNVFVRIRRCVSQHQIEWTVYMFAVGIFSLFALVSVNPFVWLVQAIAFAMALGALANAAPNRVVDEVSHAVISPLSFAVWSLQVGLICWLFISASLYQSFFASLITFVVLGVLRVAYHVFAHAHFAEWVCFFIVVFAGICVSTVMLLSSASRSEVYSFGRQASRLFVDEYGRMQITLFENLSQLKNKLEADKRDFTLGDLGAWLFPAHEPLVMPVRVHDDIAALLAGFLVTMLLFRKPWRYRSFIWHSLLFAACPLMGLLLLGGGFPPPTVLSLFMAATCLASVGFGALYSLLIGLAAYVSASLFQLAISTWGVPVVIDAVTVMVFVGVSFAVVYLFFSAREWEMSEYAFVLHTVMWFSSLRVTTAFDVPEGFALWVALLANAAVLVAALVCRLITQQAKQSIWARSHANIGTFVLLLYHAALFALGERGERGVDWRQPSGHHEVHLVATMAWLVLAFLT